MEKEKNIFYNLIRKEVIKKITCGLGEVSETDDAIVCYVDKSKIVKEKDEYVIDCYGYNGTNLDLAKKYNISKPVFYIIDDIDFSDRLCTGIYGYNGVTIVITNCNFGELTNIRNDGACRLYYSKLNNLNLYTEDLATNRADISASKQVVLLAKKMKLFKTGITSSNVTKLYGDLTLYYTHINSKNCKFSSIGTINVNASSVEAEEVFDIKCKKFESDSDSYLDVTSSRIIYNNCEVGSGKMHLTKESIDLIDKRTQLVNVFNKIRLNCESVCEEEIKKFYDRPLSKVLKIK